MLQMCQALPRLPPNCLARLLLFLCPTQKRKRSRQYDTGDKKNKYIYIYIRINTLLRVKTYLFSPQMCQALP